MAASIGGVIQPEVAWKLRILARELNVTINTAAELAANHLSKELGISFEEIPNPRPMWMISVSEGTSSGEAGAPQPCE